MRAMPRTRTASPPSPLPADAAGVRKPRADGVEARARLLRAALKLFAQKGFSKTSTREIAQAAGANIAAIQYYFGDKAGLYSATFSEPMGNPRDVITAFTPPALTLRQALEIFFTAYLAPLKQGELVQDCLRLHLREMLEPTSQWAVEIERDMRQPHDAMVKVLCRHLGLARADDDVHRLAFSVIGLALNLFACRDLLSAIRPSLLATPQAIDQWTPRIVDGALALVTAETTRRQATGPAKPLKPVATPKGKKA